MNEKAAKLQETARVLYLKGLMLAAGVPILECLGLVGQSFPRFTKVFKFFEKEIRDGAGWYETISKRPSAFPHFVVDLMKIGEETGELEKILIGAADIVNKMSRLVKIGADSGAINRIVFWRLLPLIMQNQVGITVAVEVASKVSFSKKSRREIADRINAGQPLSQALKGFIPEFDRKLVDIGERTGDLFKICESLAGTKESFLLSSQPPSKKELDEVRDYEMLALLIDSGISVLQSVTILADTASPARRRTFLRMRGLIEEGKTLAEAMEQFPKAFSAPILSMVKVGEKGGVLDVVLWRIADHLRWQAFGE